MENPSKKMKFGDELSTSPFIKLHEDVHPLILQHLSGKEVLNLFTVSPECYQVIIDLPAALKKIKLRFRESSSDDPSPQEVTALLNSARKYQNVNAHFRYLSNAGRKLLLLERFSQSIVNLDISIERNELLEKLPPSLSFPKLKSLDVTTSAQIIVKLLQASSKLEKLAIGTENMDEEVVAYLMETESLKELTLSGGRNVLFSKHSMKESKFKLKALTIKYSRYIKTEEISEQARINFETFVGQSADTLKSFQFDVWCFEDITLAFNKMPALEHLIVQSYSEPPIPLKTSKLEPNKTIKSFKCYTLDYIPKKVELLACLTNLEILTVGWIDESDFEWIARNIPTLKQLCISYWHPRTQQRALKDAEECYNMMKESALSINRNIGISHSRF
jgi:hypothetical protein